MQRRNFMRHKITSDAATKVASGIISCPTENVCIGAMFIKTDGKLNVGDRADIGIKLAGGSGYADISVTGIVKRTEPDGIAIVFRKGFCSFCAEQTSLPREDADQDGEKRTEVGFESAGEHMPAIEEAFTAEPPGIRTEEA